MCEQTPPVSLSLPLDERAAAGARRFLRDRVCRAHHSAVEHEAELLVSEVVGNGVRHGAPPIVLTVVCQGWVGMRVDVRDGSPVLPAARSASAQEESGRGIALVDLVSDSWGVETAAADGKTVWFVLNAASDFPEGVVRLSGGAGQV